MSNTDLNRNCWIAAAVTGLLVWLFTAGFGDLSLFSGLMLGIVTAALLGVFLVWITGGGDQYVDDMGASERQSVMAQPAEAVANNKRREPIKAEQITPAEDAQLKSDGAEKPVSSRNDTDGTKSVEGEAKKKLAAQSIESDEPADKKVTAPDDLKEIKGVGPKLEELLHENGITQFSQIAAWSDSDIDRYADVIGRMGGRIRSDDWVEQARILAAGGETEFSRRVEKGGVYT